MVADDVLKQNFAAVRWKEIQYLRVQERVLKATLDDCKVRQGLRTINVKRGAPRGKVDKVDGNGGLESHDREGQSYGAGGAVNYNRGCLSHGGRRITFLQPLYDGAAHL